MDPATKALIESMQKEETEKEERRKRQLEADEELARREQQSERDVWEMMQELEAENETRRRAQIEQDEIRAVSSTVSATLTVRSARYRRKIGERRMNAQHSSLLERHGKQNSARQSKKRRIHGWPGRQ